jgi:diacylglycerol kinase family enzyme
MESWDLIIVAGGDGTVSKVARAIGASHIAFAILPTGTANKDPLKLVELGGVERKQLL